MLLYEIFKINFGFRYLKNRFVLPLVLFLIYLAMGFAWPDYVLILLFSLALLSGAYASESKRTILHSKPLLFFGDISYSIYLMHVPLMFFLLNYLKKFPSININATPFSAWSYSLTYLLIVIVVSSVTYKFVEKPMRYRLNRANHIPTAVEKEETV
jgi:peptidoglycan/LPS O-acetylase OafA/YrhL